MRLFLPQCSRLILENVAQLPRDEAANICTKQIAANTNMSPPTARRHIKILKRLGLIDYQCHRGRYGGYSLRVTDKGYRCLGRYF